MKQLILHFGSALLITALIVWLNVRPYGIILIIFLAVWIYKTRCPNVMIVPPENLITKLKSSYDSLAKLRHDKPGIFFIITSITCVMFAFVGLTISGTWLVLIGLMIIGTKNKFEIIKQEPSVTTSHNDTEVDEFLLEENENNLFVLKCAGEDAVLSGNPGELNDDEDKSENEIPQELLVAKECLPEIGELSDSNSDNDDDDGIALTKQIDFKSGYFNKDYSSSDDDSITSGLNFPECNKDKTCVDSVNKDTKYNYNVKQQFEALKTQLAMKLIPSLVETTLTSAIPWSAVNNLLDVAGTTTSNNNKNKTELIKNISDSSDDSEFEILNTEDLDNITKI